MKYVTLFAVALMAFAAPSSAEESAPRFVYGDEVLSDLHGFALITERVNDRARSLGMSKGAIATRVRTELAAAGLGVLSDEQSLTAPGSPHLYVRVTVGRESYDANVWLREVVTLIRRKAKTRTNTWDRGAIGKHHGKKTVIYDSVGRMVKEFALVYKKHNRPPK